MKLLMLYNIASGYRAPIYKLIDREYDCKWMFGKNTSDISAMDTAVLKDVKEVDNITVFKAFYRQDGAYREAIRGDYDALFMLGEPFNLSTWAIMLRNKLSRRRKKVYLWSHGWYGREGFAKKWMKRAFFGLADKTFLYGNYAREVAIAQGFPAGKLAVIHNSLDHANQLQLRRRLAPSDTYRRHFGNDNPTLIFIGRLTAVKRLDLLLEAMAQLRSCGTLYNLVLVGDGEKRSELERQVRDMGLDGQVWFYGACYDDTQNAQLIYDADLCVAPGNVGLTAMHTMVFGTPVLTHDNFPMQMPEFEAIIPGKTGAFFRYNDVPSLAGAIDAWMSTAAGHRDTIRQACYNEIDTSWTPGFQLSVLKEYLR